MAYKDINEKRAKAREYYYKNKDRISARNKSNYQKPEVKAKKKAYIDVYRKTPQAMAKRRAWRQKNKEIIRVKKAEWVEKNKEHLKEYNRKRMSDPKIVARKKETTRKWIKYLILKMILNTTRAVKSFLTMVVQILVNLYM